MTSSEQYDVFLCHHSAEHATVEYLAQKLRRAGLSPFLDRWHLIPGDPWQEALEQALDQSRTCVVFLGPSGLGPWENEEMRAALAERVQNPRFRVIPVLLPGAQPPETDKLPRFLRRLTLVDLRAGLEDGYAFHCLQCGIKGIPPDPPMGHSSTAGARRPMPDHLPFLVNRHEQEDELGKTLRRVGQKPDKPVICLALGNKDQCHDMFVERLKRVSLPRCLGLPRDQDTIMARTLRWPRMSNLHENLEMQLAQELCYNTLATTDDISGVLAKGPVLLHFHLSDKEWLHQEHAVATEFLDFWQKWPLKPGQHLFICLCIEHQTQSSVGRIWRWPWEAKRMQSDPLETAMAQVITFVSSARFERLICIPLPQLGDVKFDDVKYWALSEEVQILRRHDLLTEIRLIFDQWERQMATQAMPMERIAAKLKDILPKYLA